MTEGLAQCSEIPVPFKRHKTLLSPAPALKLPNHQASKSLVMPAGG